MVEAMVGKWQLIHSENFDEYMKEVGVSWPMRQMGNLAKPNIIISMSNNKVTLTTESTFKTTSVEFELNQEFEETTADGRVVKSIFKFEDNKLVQTQKAKVDSVITRYLEDDSLIAVCEANGVKSTRKYKRITE